MAIKKGLKASRIGKARPPAAFVQACNAPLEAPRSPVDVSHIQVSMPPTRKLTRENTKDSSASQPQESRLKCARAVRQDEAREEQKRAQREKQWRGGSAKRQAARFDTELTELQRRSESQERRREFARQQAAAERNRKGRTRAAQCASPRSRGDPSPRRGTPQSACAFEEAMLGDLGSPRTRVFSRATGDAIAHAKAVSRRGGGAAAASPASRSNGTSAQAADRSASPEAYVRNPATSPIMTRQRWGGALETGDIPRRILPEIQEERRAESEHPASNASEGLCPDIVVSPDDGGETVALNDVGSGLGVPVVTLTSPTTVCLDSDQTSQDMLWTTKSGGAQEAAQEIAKECATTYDPSTQADCDDTY